MPFSSGAGWAIPRRVLGVAVLVSLLLLAPLVVVFQLAGVAPALSLGMGYVACLFPALKLPARSALAVSVPAAMAGVVAAALNGTTVAAACFVALVCLLAAPANVLQDRLVAGIPTAAAVFVSVPVRVDPVQVGGWMLAGGAIAVAVAARLRRPAPPRGISLRTAWMHAATMAVLVGVTVFIVAAFDIDHGYWAAVTLSAVLRPFGAETKVVARQRVLGTVAGAVLALCLVVVLPNWAALAVASMMFVLMVCYSILGDYAKQVTCMTPLIVLLGAPGGGVLAIAAERVAATAAGAAIAIAAALALARHERPAASGATR